METKKIKKPISFYIKHNLAIYIVAIVVFLVIISTMFDIKNKLKPNQKLNIFVASLINNEKELEDYIKDRYENIKEVTIYSYQENDPYFNSLYSIHGPLESDLIILPKTIINDDLDKYFYKIGENINTLSSVYEDYGLLIHSNDYKNEFFDNYVSFENKEYYIFISLGSVHYGKNDNLIVDFLEEVYG